MIMRVGIYRRAICTERPYKNFFSQVDKKQFSRIKDGMDLQWRFNLSLEGSNAYSFVTGAY